MTDNEPKPSNDIPAPEHYGRASLAKRYESLDPVQKKYFDAALSIAGTDFDQLQGWVSDIDFLPDDSVASCVKDIAVAISGVKLNFVQGQYNVEQQNALNKTMKDIVGLYFS
jgi:hypothetical protein